MRSKVDYCSTQKSENSVVGAVQYAKEHRVVLASVTKGHLPPEGTGVSKQPGSCKVGYRGNFV